VDIATLLRAAQDHLGGDAAFTLETATAALGWMAARHSCALTAGLCGRRWARPHAQPRPSTA